MQLNISIICGTIRENSNTRKVSRFICQSFQEKYPQVRVNLIKAEDYYVCHEAQTNSEYSQLIAKADGFVIVVPEYNHSFPGSLKMLLDSELENYNHKPVAFAGVSSGPWGGVRAIQSLIQPVRRCGLVATSIDTYFPFVQDIFDQNGQVKNQEVQWQRLEKMSKELIWMTKTLKKGRQESF